MICKFLKWLSASFNKETFKEGLFFMITGNLILAFIIGFSIYFYEKRDTSRDKEAKILQIDEYNLGIACLTKKYYKQNLGVIAGKYDTQTYKENFDFINQKSRATQESILQNIAYMEGANIMLEIVLRDPEGLEPAGIGKKIYDNADNIEKNLRKYDLRIKDTNCEN